MKLPARRAHRRLWTVLVALAVASGALLSSGSLNIGFPDRPTPSVEPSLTPSPSLDPWAGAKTYSGPFRVATTYDAFYGCWSNCVNGQTQAWYSTHKNGKPGRNAWIFANKDECAKNPGWKCYYRMVNGNKKLVRNWTSPIKNLYVALGPALMKLIGHQIPRWHTVPKHKILVTSVETGISVELWITDSCGCGGNDKVSGTGDDRIADVSEEGWAAMGRVTYYDLEGKRRYKNADGSKWDTNAVIVKYFN